MPREYPDNLRIALCFSEQQHIHRPIGVRTPTGTETASAEPSESATGLASTGNETGGNPSALPGAVALRSPGGVLMGRRRTQQR